MVTTLLILTTLYTFYMGYTDGSNAVATCVATKAMKPRFAVVLSAVVQFATVIAMYFLVKDMSVAATIGKGLIDSSAYASIAPRKAFIYLLAALLSAIVWSLITYFLKQPNSTSHTLLGGIIGAGLAAFGWNAVNWQNVLLRIVLIIFIAPIISLLIGYLINKLLRKIALRAPMGTGKVVKALQNLNVVILSSAISVNDGQKAIGVYLLIATLGVAPIAMEVPFYLVLIFAAALALGMFFGGYRIIVTIGQKLFKIKPLMSLSSQISTNLVMFTSSALGIPISTGQVISSTVVGIGVSERLRGVRWKTIERIALGWIVTMPATILFGAAFYSIIKLISGGNV